MSHKSDSPPAAPAATAESALSFTPVPCRPRVDGWTPERQAAFIAALARSGSVARASAQVGLSRRSAYALRDRPGAEGFRLAWDAARDLAFSRRAASYRAIRDAIAGFPAGPFAHLIGRRAREKGRALLRDTTP